ncbi:MAG: EamA family transporter [Methanomassiliicoccales archaeon]|nr:MAG: EamA family transporter [Methanomassiliicoccales archaeon]
MKLRDIGTEVPLLAAGVIWGSSFVSGKIGVEHMDPVLFSLLRYLFASLSVLPILLLFKEFDRTVMSSPAVIGISILNAIAINMQNIGMTMTTATNAVLLIDINVVFIAVLSVFVLKEKMSRRLVIGLMLGLIGVFITSTDGDISSIGGGTLQGNLLAFFAGIIWAFYVVYLAKTLRSGTALVSATMAIIIWTTLVQAPLTLLYAPDMNVDSTGWAMAIYTGVICTTIAFTLYSYGLRALGATTSSVILLIEIVFGMVFAVLLLDETPTAGTAIGGLFILLAVITISFKRKKEKEDATKRDQE